MRAPLAVLARPNHPPDAIATDKAINAKDGPGAATWKIPPNAGAKRTTPKTVRAAPAITQNTR